MTSLFATLPRYMARNFLYNFVFLLCLLLFLVYIFDLIELLRRVGARDIALGSVMALALLKLPEVGQIILPFVVLFSAMFSFWKLNRTSELAVMRSIGLSAFQFTFPLIVVAFCIGIFATTVLNPMSAVMLNKFETMEDKLYSRTSHLVSITKSGLWLKQNTSENEYTLLNAQKLDPDTWEIENVLLLEFDANNILQNRIQAERGVLEPGAWQLENIEIFKQLPQAERQDSLSYPTDLSPQDIIDTFSSTQVISFWKVPDFINTLRDTGFPTERIQVYYQSMLARPFFFAAMILLAAAVSLRPSRQGGTVTLVMTGVFIGFILFFSDSLLHALGISQKIPVFLGAWTSTIVSILLGGSVLLQLEDG